MKWLAIPVIMSLVCSQAAWAIEPIELDYRCGPGVGEGVFGLFQKAEADLNEGQFQAAVSGYQRVYDPLRRLKKTEARIWFSFGYARALEGSANTSARFQ